MEEVRNRIDDLEKVQEDREIIYAVIHKLLSPKAFLRQKSPWPHTMLLSVLIRNFVLKL